MKIQTKITILLCSITVLYVAGFFYIKQLENQREALVLKNNIHEKNTLYDKIVRHEEASLFMFTYEYSNRRDTLDYLTGQNIRRYETALCQTLPGFNINALWIYNADFELIHTQNSFEQKALKEFSVLDDAFKKALSGRHFWHFFMQAPRGLVEIRCVPIQPPEDTQRQSKPQGFLFAGRLWDDEYITHLSSLTDSTIELLPIANNQLLDSVYDQEQGSVSYFRIVQSWDKKPLMQLNITSTIPLISELQRTSLEQLLLMIGFVAATLILMSALLVFWVNIPLKRITRGMDSGNPAIFKGLETSHSEFGNLAKLILRFFRQQAELASSEERFRSVVQTAGDAIITLRQDGSIAFWNRGAERVFGYDAREAVGRSAEMLLPSHRKDIYYDSLAKITADTPTAFVRTPVEIVALKKNRQEFPAELSQAMWQSQDRTFYTIILRDITERKLAEEAQRKSEKRFRNIVENSLTGQCIVVDGHIRYKNQEQERLFGPLPDDHTFFDCDNVHPDDTKKVQSFYRDIISETVHTRDVEFRFYPLGKLQSAPDMRWVTCRGSTIEYQGKKALFINMMDITRFMELEQLVRVQDKMASLGRVAAGIAHEIRNPLTGITTYLYSLQTFAGNISEQDCEHMAGILQEMMNASTKIEAVIKRVMDFSRPGMPKFSVVEINSVIQDAVNLSTATLRKNDIMLTTDLCPDLPHCQADYHMIEQVLMNLIANAIQAFSGTGSQKLIKITSAPAESSVIIRISDTGPGIPPGEREKVFDPFYTTKSDGSGIGLSLCQRIITDHGGSLSITSSTWDGAEFILELPLKQALSRPRANPGVIFPEP